MNTRTGVTQFWSRATQRLLWGAIVLWSCLGLPDCWQGPLAIQGAEAATYYVRKTCGSTPSCTTPSNANNCTAKTTACLTIGGAEAKARTAGDIVYVGAETYAESVTVGGSGTWDGASSCTARIQFIADTSGTQTDDAGNVIMGTTTGGFSATGKDCITIDGFTITGGTSSSDGIEIRGLSNGITIQNTKIFGNVGTTAYGISGSGGNASTLTHYLKIDNCEIFGNGASGILNNGGDNWTITNSVLYGNGVSGIEFNRSAGTTDPSPGTISHNVIFGNASYGINGDTATTWTVKNNLIYKNGNHGIFIRAASGAVYAQYWTITNNTIDDNAASGIFFAHGSAADPGHTFQDNIITSNDTYGIERSGTAADNSTYSRNDVALNATAGYSNVTPDANSITTDPTFVGALTNGSGSWALDFDNSNDLVNVADNAALEVTKLTVEAWVRPDTLALGDGIVDRWAAGALVFAMDRRATTNGVRVRIGDGGSATPCTAQTAAVMTAGVWQHVAFSYDSSLGSNQLTIAINGVHEHFTCTQALSTATATALQIGGGRPGSNFDGLIDEVRISNNKRYTSTFVPSRHLTVDANTVALWHFNEGSVKVDNVEQHQTVNDATTNGVNGTLGASSSASTDDPAWVTTDPAFNARLQATATGQGADSPAIDKGSQCASTAGLDGKTARLDSGTDSGSCSGSPLTGAGVVDLGFHYPTSTLAQNAYRWYDNTNALQPSTATAAENAAITDVGSGTVKRLRLSIQGAGETAPSGLLLKLQYAQMSGAACDGVGETFADIGAIGSGTIWRAADNAFDSTSGNTGKTISAGLLTPTDVFGFYTEAVQTAAGPSAIASGQDVEYDWVVGNNGATDATNYCFRVVYQGGGGLSSYTNYPKITTTTASITVSGKLYSDEGTTQITTAKTIKLSVNGGTPQSATNGVSGYSFSVTGAVSGDVYTLFVDGDASIKAVTVTRGAAANATVDLYQNRLIVRHEDAGPTTNTNLGGCDKDSGCGGAGDTDLHFTSNAGALTVDNDTELHVWTGDTFTPGGAVTLSSGGADPGGDLHVIGTLSMEGNTLTVNGGGITGAGTITQTASGTTTLGATGNVGGGTYTFYNLNIGTGSSTITTTAAGNFTVSGVLTIVSSSGTNTFDASSRTITLAGTSGTPFVISATEVFTVSTSTMTYTGNNGAGNTTVTATTYNNLTINNSSETYDAGGALITNGDVTVTAGTLAMGANNLTVNGGDITGDGTITQSASATTTIDGAGNIDGGTYTFYNLILGNGVGATTTTLQAGTYTVDNTLTVAANQTLALNSINLKVQGGTITGAGTIICGATDNTCSAGGVGVNTPDATATSTWGSGSYTFYDLGISGNNNTTTLGANLTAKGTLYVGGDQVNAITAHTVVTNGYSITAGTIQISGTSSAQAVLNANGSAISTGTLKIGITNSYAYLGKLHFGSDAGTGTITITGGGTPFVINTTPGDTFDADSSTITYTGQNGAGDTTITATTYYNLDLGGAATTETYVPGGDLTVNGVLTIVSSSGINTFNASSRTITLAGSGGTPLVISASEVFTESTSTVKYTGANGAGNTTVAADTYYNLDLGHASAAQSETYVLGGDTRVNGVLTIVSNANGTNELDASSRTLTLAGTTGTPFVIGTGETFTASTSVVDYIGDNGAGSTTVTATTYYNLQVSNASGETYAAGGALVVNTALNVVGGTLAMGANDLTVGSTAVASSGKLAVASGQSLTQNASNTTTIKSSAGASNCIGSTGVSCAGTVGTITLGNLTIGDGTTIITTTLGGTTPSMTVAGVLTIAANATFDAGSGSTITLSGSGTPISRSGTFTKGTSTVKYTSGSGVTALASAAMTGSNAFNNLTINGTGTFTAGVDVTAGGTVTVQAGTCELGGNTVTAANVTAEGGTLSMTGSGGILKISGNGTLQLINGGKLTTADVATPVQITTSDTVTPTYVGITVGVDITGGVLDVSELTVDYLKSTGFQIINGTTVTKFDKVTWGANEQTSGGTDVILDITGLTKNLLNHTFPASSSKECNVRANTSGTVSMWDWSGGFGGENNDCDNLGGEVVWKGGVGTNSNSGTGQYPAIY